MDAPLVRGMHGGPVIARAISLIILSLLWAQFAKLSCASGSEWSLSLLSTVFTAGQATLHLTRWTQMILSATATSSILGLRQSQRMADTFICTLLFEWHIDGVHCYWPSHGSRISSLHDRTFSSAAYTTPPTPPHTPTRWTQLICMERLSVFGSGSAKPFADLI